MAAAGRLLCVGVACCHDESTLRRQGIRETAAAASRRNSASAIFSPQRAHNSAVASASAPRQHSRHRRAAAIAAGPPASRRGGLAPARALSSSASASPEPASASGSGGGDFSLAAALKLIPGTAVTVRKRHRPPRTPKIRSCRGRQNPPATSVTRCLVPFPSESRARIRGSVRSVSAGPRRLRGPPPCIRDPVPIAPRLRLPAGRVRRLTRKRRCCFTLHSVFYHKTSPLPHAFKCARARSFSLLANPSQRGSRPPRLQQAIPQRPRRRRRPHCRVRHPPAPTPTRPYPPDAPTTRTLRHLPQRAVRVGGRRLRGRPHRVLLHQLAADAGARLQLQNLCVKSRAKQLTTRLRGDVIAAMRLG